LSQQQTAENIEKLTKHKGELEAKQINELKGKQVEKLKATGDSLIDESEQIRPCLHTGNVILAFQFLRKSSGVLCQVAPTDSIYSYR
jgi:hypothetical protein